MSAFVFSEDLEVEMKDTIKEIPLGELHPFPDHPFGVRDDEAMAQTVGSIKEYGVLVPAIARPREDGGYEIIAGHRRKHACEIAGLKTMPVIVRDIDRNTATIVMVDSNLQRENILPSERAKAYKKSISDEVGGYQATRKTTRFNFYTTCAEVVGGADCRGRRYEPRAD